VDPTVEQSGSRASIPLEPLGKRSSMGDRRFLFITFLLLSGSSSALLAAQCDLELQPAAGVRGDLLQ